MAMLPVMRPKLPAADRLVPYLHKIDSTRIYSNYGPLVRSFEDRIAAHYGLARGTITTVANATLGLALALAAQSVEPGTLCAIPAWTFVASAHAAMLAGLIPYFIDVDPVTEVIDPDTVAENIRRAPARVSAVMPVAPFGRPIDIAAWDRFRSRTGVPVVIDAAAGFDSLTPGETPAVVSLHATKVLGVGEGGFVASVDSSLISRISVRANFGFQGSRDAMMPAMNAKLSEYHAAAGHAALDEWTEARGEWVAVADTYRQIFSDAKRLRLPDGFGQSWITSTCVVGLVDGGAARVERALAEGGIGTRRWWGDGAHAHPATAECPRARLPSTEALAHSAISLPMYRDLTAANIRLVAGRVLEACAS